MSCKHERVICADCGEDVNIYSLIGKGKKKTMSEAALQARRENGKKGGAPKKKGTKKPG